MTPTTPVPGSIQTLTVTQQTPFGVLAETADGVPGLVVGATGTSGSTLTARIDEYDAVKERFSATSV